MAVRSYTTISTEYIYSTYKLCFKNSRYKRVDKATKNEERVDKEPKGNDT